MGSTITIKDMGLKPKLFVYCNGNVKEYEVEGICKAGRNTKDIHNEIDIPCEVASRNHGVFSMDSNGYYYMDVNRKNGTYFNDELLPHGSKRYLTNGDVLRIGNQDNFALLIFSTVYPLSFKWEYISLNSKIAEINIGRSQNKSSDMFVSENHATFYVAKNGWAIADHDSTNGVFLNNNRITKAQYLRVGDCVRIARTNFIYTGDGFVYQKYTGIACSGDVSLTNDVPLIINIQERSVWQRAKKLMLLQNINMTLNSGEIALVLGGSGAGKTTFMHAVTGYEKATGKIMYGDTDIYEDFESMKYKIGFVPQQNLLRTNDTVYDTLKNAAELKLPLNIKKDEREKRITESLQLLGLNDKRDSLVSKLSGGECKRLSIATEYITDPSLFFLDEPDSGVDAEGAKDLLMNLRTIADEGKIVMIISHSPNRFAHVLDKVIVLAKSTIDNCGHLAFFGSVQEAYDFFETDSLEDIVKQIKRPGEGGDGKSDYYIEKYNQWNGGVI